MPDSTSPQSGPSLIRLNDLTVVSGHEAMLHEAGLDTLDSWFRVESASVLTKPGLSAWRERLKLEFKVKGESKSFYLKRYARPPAATRRDVLKSGSGASSVAGVEWHWMHRFRADGLACAEPIALGEEFDRGREVRSAILTAAAAGDALERLSLRWTDANRPLIRELLRETADLVARLHGGGYVHRDLYLSHIFCDPAAPPGGRLRLIDLQRVFRPSCCVLRWRIKDLAALNYSTPDDIADRGDRLGFLRDYVERCDPGIGFRPLVYRIVGKTEAIARHDYRRARRLSRGRIAMGFPQVEL